MKLKLVDMGKNKWCVHTDPDDVHLAALRYAGSGVWRMRMAEVDPASEVDDDFMAKTVDEAGEYAMKKVVNGEIYRSMLGDSSMKPLEASEMALLYQGVLEQFFRSFVHEGVSGINEFINLTAIGLGNAISVGAKDPEACLEMATKIVRDTISQRAAFTNMISAAIAAVKNELPGETPQNSVH